MRVSNKHFLLSVLTILAVAAGYIGLNTFLEPQPVFAASTIVVNSVADDEDNDGECTLREAIASANTDTVSGAAVGECIAGSGSDSIHFNLSGTPDYNLGTSPGFEIAISSRLPDITTPMIINGYSQSQSAVNTAVSPAPFNSKILVEVNGSSMPDVGFTYECFYITGTTDVEIRGLLINACGGDGIRLFDTTSTTIQGNFIGMGYNDTTDIATVSEPNGGLLTNAAHGSGIYIEETTFTLIGGTEPEDRNLISGNQFSEVFINSSYADSSELDPAESSFTTIQGNYFGLAGDGITAMPCGYEYGHGNSILITHSSNDVIGGDIAGARNVIASSKEYGISFRNGSSNSVVEGNYIGTDYTGNTAATHTLGAGHPQAGISVATVSNGGYTLGSWNITIGGPDPDQGNVISGNSSTTANEARGIYIHDTTRANIIQNNTVGLGADGVTELGNQVSGIELNDTDDTEVVDNLVGDNTTGIFVSYNTDDITVNSNIVKDNSDYGIDIFSSSNLIVGASGAGNQVYGNGIANIRIVSSGIAGYPTSDVKVQDNSIGVANWQKPISPPALGGTGILVTGDPTNILIGGSGADQGNVIVGSVGQAVGIMGVTIEVADFTLATTTTSVLGNTIYGTYETGPPGAGNGPGIDLFTGVDTDGPPDGVPNSFSNIGQNPNDPAGSVPGMPNNFLNYPVLSGITQNGNNATVAFDTTLDGAVTDTYRVELFANDTNQGSEGKTFLGTLTVSPGSGQSQQLTLPNGTNLTGKYITATATEINGGGGNNDGFGATSEFSDAVAASVTALPNDTGGNQNGNDGGGGSGSLGSLSNTGSFVVIGVVAGLILVAAAIRLFQLSTKKRNLNA
jgi:CSLREA domain-containing protein